MLTQVSWFALLAVWGFHHPALPPVRRQAYPFAPNPATPMRSPHLANLRIAVKPPRPLRQPGPGRGHRDRA